MTEEMGVCRLTAVVVAGALLLCACGWGGNMAPVAKRNTAGTAANSSTASTSASLPTAVSQAPESDWTATVRPLGDSGATTTRALADDDSATETVAAAPPTAQTQAAPTPASAGSGSSAVNPAVVSLLNTASTQSRAGDYARAAATLERAIAIEPDNPWLWHRLADSRLKEGRLELAAGLAAKSSSLPGADRSLQADNWKVIAEVRRRQGDAGAAAAAEAQARKLVN